MVNTLRQLTDGHKLQDATRNIQLIQHVISWVDDTVNKESLLHQSTLQDKLQALQHTSIQWRRILHVTGGDLELSKTVVYLIDYVFSQGGTLPHLSPKHKTPGTILIPAEGPSEKDSIISRNEPCQAERYVGVRIAPNGQMETEYKYRLKQSKELGLRIAQAHLTRPEATLAFHSRWLSIIGFYLPITCFSRKQCETIQTPIYQAILPKLGYNQHIPLAIRYEPTCYGGAALPHTYTEEIIKHIQYVTGTLRQKTELSQKTTIALSHLQIMIGSSKLFLNLPQSKYNHLSQQSRHIFLWDISNECNITYTIDSVYIPPLMRIGDRSLMDIFIEKRLGNSA